MTAANYESANHLRPQEWWRLLLRVILSFLLTALLLYLIMTFFPSLGSISNFYSAMLAILLLAALVALLWPLLVMGVLKLLNKMSPAVMFMIFPVFSLLTYALFILLASRLTGSFQINGIWSALLVALLLTIAQAVLSAFFAYDDEGLLLRRNLKKVGAREIDPKDVGKPGIIFLEIDGLGEKVLRYAMAKGKVPTMKRWLESGSHKLVGWESDFSTQTSAAQAGILHGNNFGIHAFRWYDKTRNDVVDSASLEDVARIEKGLSDGNGLLCHGGAVRASLFSGDASHVLITGSRLFDQTSADLRSYYLNPSSVLRSLALMCGDWVLEKKAAWGQSLRGEQPRIKRGGVYFLLRSAVAVVLKDFSIFTIRGDMYAGVPYAYATLAGYDEVAHHSGIRRPDAMEVLRKLDREFGKLERAALDAPRKYKFVVLSDHGQAQGATYRQRYGETFEDTVRRLLAHDGTEYAVAGYDTKHESAYYIEAAFKDMSVSNSGLGHQVEKAIKNNQHTTAPDVGKQGVVVTASGNLGFIYFLAIQGRASMEELDEMHPGLLPGLVAHPGVGFIMVNSKQQGPLVIGKKGTVHLSTGEVEGEDPLSDYGPSMLHNITRQNGFPEGPDVLVNSTYWKDADEVAAFEELVGSHGGAGGEQSRPFILYPSDFDLGSDKIVGAESVYRVFKRWTADLRRA